MAALWEAVKMLQLLRLWDSINFYILAMKIQENNWNIKKYIDDQTIYNNWNKNYYKNDVPI